MSKFWTAVVALFSVLAPSALVAAQSVAEGIPEYIAPFHPTPPGKATGMKVQLLVEDDSVFLLTILPNGMQKRFDPETDLTLIDPITHQ